ncbi:AEC family transporter, partial [Dubosiella newyorkensis]|uniref:AEC family transporter n=1 Tax=Dubosiella newyorkensis TaxID=1862672 RepID=UPI00258AAEFC
AYGELGLLFASFFLIPQRVVMWSAGLSLYTTKTSWQEKVKKVITHPCIIALAIGFAILLMRMEGIYLPSALDQTIAAISACNTPICLFVIGAMLEQSETKDLFSKTMRKYCLLRLLILPAIVLVIMKSFQLPLLAIQICVIESAMPAATTSAMLALRYDQDPAFASKMVFVSTLFSLFTLPLWLYIL